MIWLIYCALFLVMLAGIVRMLNRSGKWGWLLFLGLVASVPAYVLLFVEPVVSSPRLQTTPVWLGVILTAGTLLYVGGMIVFIRRMTTKLKGPTPPT